MSKSIILTMMGFLLVSQCWSQTSVNPNVLSWKANEGASDCFDDPILLGMLTKNENIPGSEWDLAFNAPFEILNHRSNLEFLSNWQNWESFPLQWSHELRSQTVWDRLRLGIGVGLNQDQIWSTSASMTFDFSNQISFSGYLREFQQIQSGLGFIWGGDGNFRLAPALVYDAELLQSSIWESWRPFSWLEISSELQTPPLRWNVSMKFSLNKVQMGAFSQIHSELNNQEGMWLMYRGDQNSSVPASKADGDENLENNDLGNSNEPKAREKPFY